MQKFALTCAVFALCALPAHSGTAEDGYIKEKADNLIKQHDEAAQRFETWAVDTAQNKVIFRLVQRFARKCVSLDRAVTCECSSPEYPVCCTGEHSCTCTTPDGNCPRSR